MVEIFRAIQTRKGQLHAKCFRKSEPKVIFLKTVPKYELIDFEDLNRDVHRLFNRSLEKRVKWLKYFYALNLDQIIPSDASLFELLAGTLTHKGYEEYWSSVNQLIKKVDSGEVKLHTNQSGPLQLQQEYASFASKNHFNPQKLHHGRGRGRGNKNWKPRMFQYQQDPQDYPHQMGHQDAIPKHGAKQ